MRKEVTNWIKQANKDLEVAEKTFNIKEYYSAVFWCQQAIEKGLADKLYLTLVDGNFDADTFFPDYSDFKKVVSEEKRESDGYVYRFLELERV